MSRYEASDDHQPILWLREYPIYAAHLLVVVLVASMLATTVLLFLDARTLLAALTFDSSRVLQGEVWRLLTYGFVNPPSLWFAIKMVMIVWFGREVEKFLGRRVLLRFYGGLYLFLPLFFTLIGLARPMYLAGEPGSFALFIAFATLYPNAILFFNLLVKWVAGILVGIYTLMALSQRDTAGLISLWTTVGFAYAFVRFQQGRFTLPKIRLATRQSRLRELPPLPTQKSRRPRDSRADPMIEIDALLDKIAQSGYASLTPQERERLEAARENLRNRKPGGS